MSSSKRRSVPQRTSSLLSWQEKLHTLNLNTIHSKRSCDVFFMAEYTEACTRAIERFNYGAHLDPKNVVKSLDFEDVLMTVKKISNDSSTLHMKGYDHLFKQAAKEAATYLNNEEVIPCKLVAKLIKLQIVLIMNEDIIASQKDAFVDKGLENERVALVQLIEKPSQKKGKGKGGKEKAGKAKVKAGKGKDKKGTVQEKLYDVCDSNNEIRYKISSTLRRDRKYSPTLEVVEVPHKHLFIVIVGFYDFELIQQLYKAGVPLTGILELSKSGLGDTHSESPVLPQFEGINDSVSDSESCIVNCPLYCTENIKTTVLSSFWNKFYECFESDGFPDYFENTFHMTVFPSDLAFAAETLDDQNCVDVFADIGTNIVKSADIMRQHINYVRHLKICDVSSKPHRRLMAEFNLYNHIMNMVPPECVNIPFLLYAVTEQINNLVPALIDAEIESKSVSSKLGIFLRATSENNEYPMHSGIKSYLAEVLNKNINVHSFCKPAAAHNNQYKANPKLDFNISRKPFMIHDDNDLEITISPYDKIASEFMNITVNNLKRCVPVLLWKNYSNEEQIKILVNKYHLNKTCHLLDIPLHELQYAVHTVFFNSIKCSGGAVEDSCCHCCSCCSLQMNFPYTKDITPKVEPFLIPHIAIRPSEKEFREEMKTSIPHAVYVDVPNLYEAKNMSTYKWYENLSAVVMLQELNKAEQNYLCLDYKYCPVDDTLLLRYHNDLDEFGINRQVWSQSLRTPVFLKEFCKYIIHEEAGWLAEQEAKYILDYEKEFEQLKGKDRELKQAYYPDLQFTDNDFIQPRSIKGNALLELHAPKLATQVDAKGKKDNKKKGKGVPDKGSKGKAKAVAAPLSRIALLEKLSQSTVPPFRRKLTLRYEADEPYSFFAYDVSRHRVQLTGSTIVFHSQDGVKVTVDQTRLFRAPNNLSLTICTQGHSLMLHRSEATSDPFMFHFSLSDGTIVAFNKPPKASNPEEEICEKICQAIKYQKNSLEKAREQPMYFVSERQNHVMKCFNIPYITQRHLILSEELLGPFLKQLSKRRIPVKLMASKETLSSNEIRNLEEAFKSESKGSSAKMKSGSALPSRSSVEAFLPKYAYGIISKASLNNSDIPSPTEEFRVLSEQPLTKSKKSLLSSRFSDLALLRRSPDKIISHIRKAVACHLPVFKICSSRLHKYQYVRRVKSFVEVQVGPVLKRLTFKPPSYTVKRNLEITKLLPVKQLKVNNTFKYDLRICLPSGLLIQSIAGLNKELFQIRQRYLDSGPQCKSIAHESYRMFTRNGTILIKQCDGNIDILSIDRQMVYCDVPYLKVQPSKRSVTKKKRECKSCKFSNLIALHTHTSHLTKFQKYLHRLIHRLQKHLISGPERHHLLSHKVCQRWKRRRIRDPNQVYILQNTVAPFTKFSLITSDGNNLKVTRTAIVDQKKYYTSTTTDYRYEEIFYDREDGTHSILNRDSTLVTQFPDGTRISSWIDIAPELLVVIEDEDPECFDNRCHKGQQTEDFVRSSTNSILSSNGTTSTHQSESTSKSLSQDVNAESNSKKTSIDSTKQKKSQYSVKVKITPDESGWVCVFVNFKYEHPNYATIIYYGMREETEIILPNGTTLKASSEGEYTMNINESIRADLDNEKISLESTCTACRQNCVSVLNIKPLYDKMQPIPLNTELLRTTDSYNKIFIVNYDGQCYRNTNFHSKRSNAVGCSTHDKSEHQKLYLLSRNLNGCKFWDVSSYKNRMIKAGADSRTVIESSQTNVPGNVATTTLKTYVKEPHDEKYMIPHVEPELMFTKNKSKTVKEAESYYVTRQVITALPGLSKLFPIYSLLVDMCNKESLQVRVPASTEFYLFLNQIVSENAKREETLEEQLQAKLEAGRIVVEVKDTPVPLDIRWKAWREACKKYKTEIQERYVPNYFYSQYDTFYKKSIPHMPTTNPFSDSYVCPSSSESRAEDTVISKSSNVLNNVDKNDSSKQDVVAEKLTTTEMDVKEQITKPSNNEVVNEAAALPKESYVAQIKAVMSPNIKAKDGSNEEEPACVEKVSPKVDIVLADQTKATTGASRPKKPSCCDTPMGSELFNEVTAGIANLVKFTTKDEDETISSVKVEFVADRIYSNIKMALQEYDGQTPNDEFVAAALVAILENVVHARLNSSELNLLLTKIKEEASPKSITALCSPSTTLSEKCHEILKGIHAAQNTRRDLPQDSAFAVYSCYSNIYSILRPGVIEEPKSTSTLNSETHFATGSEEATSTKAFESLSHSLKISSAFSLADPKSTSKTKHIATHKVGSSVSYADDKKDRAGASEDKCKRCTIRSKLSRSRQNVIIPSQHSLGECPFRFPSFRSVEGSITPQESSLSLQRISSDVHGSESSTSNLIEPQIIVSPESSLLRYCLSEVSIGSDHLAVVDDRTLVLDKDDLNQPESLMVMFSIASLKKKATAEEAAGPYVERNPKEVVDNIVAASKSTRKNGNFENVASVPGPLRKPTVTKRVVSEESLYNCDRCILRADNSDHKDASLHSITDVIGQIKAGESLVVDRHKMGDSLMNIFEECIKRAEKPKHHSQNKFAATVSDKDAKILKSGQPTKSQTVVAAGANPKLKLVRRTLGTLTQPGTTDSRNQTDA